MAQSEGIGIIVYALDTDGKNVQGWLTGTGAGKYTGVIVGDAKSGLKTVAVLKSSIELLI